MGKSIHFSGQPLYSKVINLLDKSKILRLVVNIVVNAILYRDLYATHYTLLSSNSRNHKEPKWMRRLQVIDSTTITLFFSLLFKGVGRHPKIGKKKGGIKVHTVIQANEGVPSDIKFTSAATNDSFMLRPAVLNKGDIMAKDRAYIDYEKLEEMTQRGVIYVTKMKKNLKYKVLNDTMYQSPNGLMKCEYNMSALQST